jgi:ATP adenylyltransferase/5',5'''-P-1,P-4-tetraphosphate phosphorylase II
VPSTRHLTFNTHIVKHKPENLVNRGSYCPFCDRANLTDILDEQGTILWLKNKYPVLEDTFQTVIVETDECEGELSTYDKAHLYALIRFAVERWLHMEESGEYTSVLLFKNHGYQSGGSLRHPHMQIVGLHTLDYRSDLRDDFFSGLLIHQSPGVEFNISTAPRVGFIELNVRLFDFDQLDRMADYIQVAAHYLMHHFNKACDSYNLFFYQWRGEIIAKIMPRFPTSPLVIGYGIPQVSSRILEVVSEIQNHYFNSAY